MKVVLDMEKLRRLNSGLGQFCHHLGKALTHHEASWGFYLEEKQFNHFGSQHEYLPWKRSQALFGVPTDASVWHSLHQEARYLPRDRSIPLVVTIHDLNILDRHSGGKKNRYLARVQKLIDRAAVVAFISRYTQGVCVKHLRLSGKRQEVIYNGVALDAQLEPVRPGFMGEQPFVFWIGIIGRKKNVHTLISALRELPDLNLYLCGDKSGAYARDIERTVKHLGLEGRVVLPGFVSEAEKLWMYQNCQAFLFPSISEGFGLPVIEAMSAGAPVVISRLTSLPEVGGEEAVYLDSFEPMEIARKIEIARGQNDRKEARVAWSGNFSWQRAADRYYQLYQSLE